jgi:hypothetical protein
MQFPVFQSRLRDIIDAIRKLGPLSKTVQWQADLDAEGRDTEYWTKAISDGTTDEVKELLSHDAPPSPDDFKKLTRVPADMSSPGGYLGFVEHEDVSVDSRYFTYVGSGTGVGRGLHGRTSQHLNPEYREKLLKYGCSFPRLSNSN